MQIKKDSTKICFTVQSIICFNFSQDKKRLNVELAYKIVNIMFCSRKRVSHNENIINRRETIVFNKVRTLTNDNLYNHIVFIVRIENIQSVY